MVAPVEGSGVERDAEIALAGLHLQEPPAVSRGAAGLYRRSRCWRAPPTEGRDPCPCTATCRGGPLNASAKPVQRSTSSKRSVMRKDGSLGRDRERQVVRASRRSASNRSAPAPSALYLRRARRVRARADCRAHQGRAPCRWGARPTRWPALQDDRGQAALGASRYGRSGDQRRRSMPRARRHPPDPLQACGARRRSPRRRAKAAAAATPMIPAHHVTC